MTSYYPMINKSILATERSLDSGVAPSSFTDSFSLICPLSQKECIGKGCGWWVGTLHPVDGTHYQTHYGCVIPKIADELQSMSGRY